MGRGTPGTRFASRATVTPGPKMKIYYAVRRRSLASD